MRPPPRRRKAVVTLPASSTQKAATTPSHQVKAAGQQQDPDGGESEDDDWNSSDDGHDTQSSQQAKMSKGKDTQTPSKELVTQIHLSNTDVLAKTHANSAKSGGQTETIMHTLQPEDSSGDM